MYNRKEMSREEVVIFSRENSFTFELVTARVIGEFE